MISEFYFLILIDALSILLICAGYGYTLATKHDKNITELLLVCAFVSFVVGVVFWINIILIFNL